MSRPCLLPHVFCLLLLAAPSPTDAQWQPGLSASDRYERSLEGLVLLQDRDRWVPLKRLDTLRLAYWDQETELDSVVLQSLRKYMTVRILGGDSAEDRADLLLVTLTGQPDPTWLRHLDSLGRKYPLGLLLHRSDSIRTGWETLREAGLLLLLPEDQPRRGVELLFGGVGGQQRLKKDLGPYPAGAGLDVPGPSRLGSAPAAWVGLDGQKLADSLDALIRVGIDSQAYPGAQAMVIRRGKIVFHKTYGYHTFDSLQPVRPDDLYDLASITKVTAPLPPLIKWYGENRFELDAPLRKYASFYRWGNKKNLTFREMLAHQAGLRAWIPYWQGTLRKNARYPWRKRWQSLTTADSPFRNRSFRADSSGRFPYRITDRLWLYRKYPRPIYKAIRKSPLRETKDYLYSGLLFYILPEMITHLSGEPYEAYLKQTFYHRLGACSLTFNPLREFPAERIIPTERDTFFRQQLLLGIVHDEGAAMMQGVSGNAGLFGTALDLAKLLQMYLQKGQYGGEHYFAAEAMEEFTRYQYPENGNRRGLGFDKPPLEYVWGESYVAPSASPESYGHSGYTGTFFWIDPAEELIFIFLSNRVYPSRTNRKLYQLNLRPRMHEAVYQAIQKPVRIPEKSR